MKSYSGCASQYDFMVPMWKLAHRNNQKPMVVTRRKLKKDSDSKIFVRGV